MPATPPPDTRATLRRALRAAVVGGFFASFSLAVSGPANAAAPKLAPLVSEGSCPPPAPLPETLDPAALRAALEAPDPGQVSPWRAIVHTGTLEIGGSAFPLTRDPLATAVLLTGGDSPRLLVWDEYVAVVAVARADELERVVVRTVSLSRAADSVPAPAASTPSAKPPLPNPTPRVELGPGTRVRVLGVEPNGAIRVRVGGDAARGGVPGHAWLGDIQLSGTGWLPSDALGTSWAPCAAPDMKHDVALVPAAEAPPGTSTVPLLDAPDGAPLAVLAARDGWMGRTIGKPVRTKRGSWTPVVFTAGTTWLQGWVASARLASTGRAHMYRTGGWTESAVAGVPSTPHVTLPAGVWLYAPGADTVVGRTRDTLVMPLVADGDRTRTRVRTPLGALEVDVRCGTRTPSSNPGSFVCTP